jgi:hypothetical protein
MIERYYGRQGFDKYLFFAIKDQPWEEKSHKPGDTCREKDTIM